jgi:hypothetical protein
MSTDDSASVSKRAGLIHIAVWLPPDVVAELDALVAKKNTDISKVTRASLVRYWITRGLADARRSR